MSTSLAPLQHVRKALRTQPQRIERYDECIEIYNLRRKGLSFEEIAIQMGGISPKEAYEATQYLMKHAVKETTDEVKELELRRLDGLIEAFYDEAKMGNSKAAETVLRIMDAKAKYLGLHSPEKMDVGVSVVFKELQHETI